MNPVKNNKKIDILSENLSRRIVILDGAMGTMIQRLKLKEVDFRGKKFADHNTDVLGNNDLLNISNPDFIREIHAQYLEAGADIIETNTFNSNAISQSDYGLESYSYDLNYEGAKIAREIADDFSKNNNKKIRFVAGAIGPTNRTASISPKVDDPGFRNVIFDDLVKVYSESAKGLIDGGVDILLIETVFDTLNCKAAILSLNQLFETLDSSIPVMISGTITDNSGRNLSGQTSQAFWYSVRHAQPFSIGLNCAFGAQQLRPHLLELSRIADTFICAYPNAGLPNALGEYDETPKTTATFLQEWSRSGLINMLGGCCGTTPSHIKEIADSVVGIKPRAIPKIKPGLCLSGLEGFRLIK